MLDTVDVYRCWDAEYKPPEYSYVDAALCAGYKHPHVRPFGCRAVSSRPSPTPMYNALQVPVQAQVIKRLTRLASAGDLLKIARVTDGDRSLALSQSLTHQDRPRRRPTTCKARYPDVQSDAALPMVMRVHRLAQGRPCPACSSSRSSRSSTPTTRRTSTPPAFRDRGSGYLVFALLNVMEPALAEH
ncbi:hypothetical protein PG994_014376 [Apiospora phragmitis]|uniref:F-box domain-containing protein n=1 Tax=Apiospora phragmitis TaxID=2905665 RepID=A0ABR1T470_9PEZI